MLTHGVLWYANLEILLGIYCIMFAWTSLFTFVKYFNLQYTLSNMMICLFLKLSGKDM